jgi:hypothetical protein
MSLRAAREFRSPSLGAVKGLRLSGLSFARVVALEFLREEAPQQGHGAPGAWTALTRGVRLVNGGDRLGFDVLGAQHGGSFHTFSCNGLEQEFNLKLGISFNEHGLIVDYVRVVAACEYSNRDDVGAESVAWYPFRVDGHGFKDAA